MRWFVLLVLGLLLLPAAASALTPESADTLRSKLATEMVIIADGADYRMECGDANVLKFGDKLSALPDYPNDAVVCVMEQGRDKAVMFTFKSAPAAQKKLIEHFISYGDERIENSANTRLINKLPEVNTGACAADTDLGRGWARCNGNVIRGVANANQYNFYIHSDLAEIDDENQIYLLTYGNPPPFDGNIIDTISDFFTGLLGLGGASEINPGAFWKGYFAQDGDLELQALFSRPESDDLPGEAVFIFRNFGTRFDTLNKTPEDYLLGHDHRQVVLFDRMTVDTWRKLASSIRMDDQGLDPVQGDICNNGVLGFNEECENIGAGFISNYDSCAEVPNDDGDLDYFGGELGCSNCLLDISGCQKCEDSDDDGYSSTEGLPNELSRLSGEILIGSAMMDTDYDQDSDDYADDKTLREEANLQAQAILLPLNHFNLGGGLRGEAETLATSIMSCYTEPDATPASCFHDGLETAANSIIGPRSAFVNNRMDDPNTITASNGCTWSLEEGWVCSGEMAVGELGWSGTEYQTPLAGMYAEGIEPYFIISIGVKERPWVADPNDFAEVSNKVEVALSCGILAKGAQNRWDIATSGGGGALENFIYNVRPRSGADQHFGSYQACRSGIKAALSPAAKLYLNPGPHHVHAHTYDQIVKAHEASGAIPSRVIDGLVVPDGETYLTGGITLFHGYSLPRIRQEVGARLIIMPAIVPTTPEGLAKVTLGALRANAHAIFFMGLKNPIAGEPFADEHTLLFKEILSSITLKTLYRPAENGATDAQTIIAHEDGDTVVYIAGAVGDALPLTFNLCDQATVETVTSWEFTEDADGPEDYASGLPSGKRFARFSMSDWSCFIEFPDVAGCEGISNPDCDDTESSINPGATEVCDDGIDNNCILGIDEVDCDDDLPPSTDCNYDTICQDGELETCLPDCAGKIFCPTDWTSAGSLGEYRLHLRSDDVGFPELKISTSGSCGFYNTAEKNIIFKVPDPINYMTIYHEGGEQSAEVQLLFDTVNEEWRIKYIDGGSPESIQCWGYSGVTTLRQIPLPAYDCREVDECDEDTPCVRARDECIYLPNRNVCAPSSDCVDCAPDEICKYGVCDIIDTQTGNDW